MPGITQPRWGVKGQRYGSFAGKAGTSRPVGILTQPRWGIKGQRYSSFAGKALATTHPVGILSQPRWGVKGQRYGAPFVVKPPAPVIVAPPDTPPAFTGTAGPGGVGFFIDEDEDERKRPKVLQDQKRKLDIEVAATLLRMRQQ